MIPGEDPLMALTIPGQDAPEAQGRGQWVFVALVLVFVAVIGLAGPLAVHRDRGGTAAAPDSTRSRTSIVFMTDYGTANDAAAICRAVIAGIAPEARIMDITHEVTPYDLGETARFLEAVTPYYPAGTVFLVVVDPGVGTPRKSVIVRSKKGQYFVLPDNGVVSGVLDRDGFDGAREITNPAWMIGAKISSTFHGRDIFSPTAAHLANGWDWTAAGPEVTELVHLQRSRAKPTATGLAGEIIGLDDPYGNLISNITAEELAGLGYRVGDTLGIRLGGKAVRIPFAHTFGDVGKGEALLYIDSRGRVAIALNQGDYAARNGITPPVPIELRRALPR